MLKQVGKIAKACRYYVIFRETYYEWFKKYNKKGD